MFKYAKFTVKKLSMVTKNVKKLRTKFNICIFFNFRSIQFKTPAGSSKKFIAEEIIEEIKDEKFLAPAPAKQVKTNDGRATTIKTSSGTQQKSSILNNLVKRKQPLVVIKSKTDHKSSNNDLSLDNTTPTNSSTVPNYNDKSSKTIDASSQGNSGSSSVGGLSLLSAYSDSSGDSE